MPLRIVVLENMRGVAFWRAVGCEVLATAIFVFIGCGSVVLSLNEDAPATPSTTVRIALAFGFATNILIKVFGPISGCHINPAVSIAFMIVGKVSLVRATFYTLAEIIGAIGGAGILYAVLPPANRVNLGATKLLNNVTPGQGVATEAILTFILLLAISACLDDQRIEHFKMRITNPLTIGLTIAALELVGIPFTGGSMNPARSFGPAVVTLHWRDHWVYWVGPIVGACLATIVYHFLISPPLQIQTGTPDETSNPDSDTSEKSCCNTNTVSRRVPPVFMRECSQVVDVPLESYNCSVAVDLRNFKAGY